MKELVGIEQDRIQFLNNLNVKKFWDFELQNVMKRLEEQSSPGEELDALWRLLVLEWNSVTSDNLKYFLKALNNVKTSRHAVKWYNLVMNSQYAGDILFVNLVKKDLLSSDWEIRNSALKMVSFGKDDSWLGLKEMIEFELNSKKEEIRTSATRAYFQILRRGKGDSRKILKTLVDQSPKVMEMGLIGIQEFSLYNQVEIQSGLLYILKQVHEPIVQLRILKILENLNVKDVEYLKSLKHDPNIGFNVKRVLLKQGIYDLQEIIKDLESMQEEKEKMGLLLLKMLPIKEKFGLLQQVKRLKFGNNGLIRKFSFSVLSETGNLEDLQDFFHFWSELKDILDENECLQNVKNWLSRDFTDFDKMKGWMISLRLLSDEERLGTFDQVFKVFDGVLQDEGNEGCLKLLEDEIQRKEILETNISRLYLFLLDKVKECDLLIKIIVDCAFKCIDVVLQENFVSLIGKKRLDSKRYEKQIERLFKLETKDELVLKVRFLLK